MWNTKKKAVTFSFDDGSTQDLRLIDILNKYALKATFNLNSELLGVSGTLNRNGRIVRHDKLRPETIRSVYCGHEIAAHTLTHPNLLNMPDQEVIRQVENDRLNLSDLCGYEVIGMAYPGGFVDDRVVKIIRENTGIKYSRTVKSTFGFERQKDLLRFNPSVYFIEKELDEVIDRFLNTDEGLLYIWGHSFELDAEYITWEKFESVCKKLSGLNGVFYGTNRETLLD